jgi:hypothetical protein
MTGHPIFHVDADADTGEWITARNGHRVDTLVNTGERASWAEWFLNHDTPEFHYDTFEVGNDEDCGTDTCFVLVHFVRG